MNRMRLIKRNVLLQALRCTHSGSSFRTTISDLDPGYIPHKLEANELDERYFHGTVSPSSKPFTLIFPPPNVTGELHLGHALTASIQDVLVRWKQLQGMETVWVPGMDHAGIATQVMAEKRLYAKSQKTRHDLGRKLFEYYLWSYQNEKKNKIGDQLRLLDLAMNWDREVFTMDPEIWRASAYAFIKFFDSNLIYRSNFLVNWSCILQSTISDIEVKYKDIDGPKDIPVPGYDKPVRFGQLYKFAYKLANSSDEIIIATTRPETMLGDTAVAVNPSDKRYSQYVGKYLYHPFRKKTIPIIADSFVDPSFGTGAVKITPAHDRDDFDVGKRHNLESLKVIDEKGNVRNISEQFAGMKRFLARDSIVNELDRLGLLRGISDHQMIVPVCSRSGDIIELLLKPQWFLRTQKMAGILINDIREGNFSIEPNNYEKYLLDWLENIQDWCISRQIWWGHRIPAFLCYSRTYLENQVWVAAENAEVAKLKAASKLGASIDDIELDHQDEDVLDTWFSSSLLPFAAFGWPQQSHDFVKNYPLSIMETGHDILFFWVSRMAMLGTYLTGRLPFNKVLLHGIICDSQGKKMSKSLGNVIAPEKIISGATSLDLQEDLYMAFENGVISEEEMKRASEMQKKMYPEGIQECGSDALRFTLCSHNVKNRFINFSTQECYVNKLFCNKIWQATRYTNMWVKNVLAAHNVQYVKTSDFTLMDKWILSRLSDMISTVNGALDSYEFHIATKALKTFLYYDFCDIYLESTKRGLRNLESKEAAGHCWTLVTSLDKALKMLSPFMPRLSQHLHKNLVLYPGVDVDSPSTMEPTIWRNVELETAVERATRLIISIRRLKQIFGITAKHKPQVHILSPWSSVKEFQHTIQDLAGCNELHINQTTGDTFKYHYAQDIVEDSQIYLFIPEELKTSLVTSLPKLHKKRDKLVKELERWNEIISQERYKIRATSEIKDADLKKIAALEEGIQRIKYIQDFTGQL